MKFFCPADIWIPKEEYLANWPVVACDQYTSQPQYWEQLRNMVGEAPSTVKLILPEAELGRDDVGRIGQIHDQMSNVIESGILSCHKDCYVYVERTLTDGSVRQGIVGVIDLEAYDYHMGADTPVRATEEYVPERIPPRVAVRKEAALDMSHVLLLADDEENILFAGLEQIKNQLTLLYSLDLMGDGGHISGWLVEGNSARALTERVGRYEEEAILRGTLVYAVGDGNHSLAAAKECYRKLTADGKNTKHPSRYALVELENFYHSAQCFEPIHRVVEVMDPQDLLHELSEKWADEGGIPVRWCTASREGIIPLNTQGKPTVISVLQSFLDDYICRKGGKIDYIHGDDVVLNLVANDNRLGFLLPTPEKSNFFRMIQTNGVLPRKAFSMGKAWEKRYYLETRLLY